MKILILGTSNSIIHDGWTAGLRKGYPEAIIENLSIGASPGTQFGVYAHKDFSGYDYVFFDSVPNDEQYSNDTPGYKSNDLMPERVLFEIISTIQSQTNLIVMGICHKDYLYEPSDIFKRRLQMAMAVGAAFIDFPTLVIKAGALMNEQKLYDDVPSHPSHGIMNLIGQMIGHELRENPLRKAAHTEAINYRDNFHSWTPDTSLHQNQLVSYSNSLLTMQCVTIDKEHPLQLNQSNRCVGFYINAATTACDVVLGGDPATAQRARLYYRLKDFKLVKLFVPLPQAIVLDKISVEAPDLKNQKFFQPRMTHPEPQSVEAKMDLAEILFWTGNENDPWHHKPVISEAEATRFSNALLKRIESSAQTSRQAAPVAHLASAAPASPVAQGQPMAVTMTMEEIDLFQSFMKHAQNYIEFGSGGNTILASKTIRGTITSIDSWKERLDRVAKNCPADALTKPNLIYVDIGPVKEWGYPIDNSRRDYWPDYHTNIWRKLDAPQVDLYLINGRFRVACFIEAMLHAAPDSVVLVNDFRDRPHYHVMREFGREITSRHNLSVFVRRGDFNPGHAHAALKTYGFATP